MMGFGEAIATCFRKYVTFSGRARRPEYWWFVLFQFLVNLVLTILDGALFGFGEDNAQPLSGIFALATLPPALAVGWRRLHDVGKPGYFIFLPLFAMLPFAIIAVLLASASQEAARIGPILAAVAALAAAIYVFVLLVSRSECGENRFGPEPGAEIDASVFD